MLIFSEKADDRRGNETFMKFMEKKKVLFLIHDLGQGGAEKVLVNLVNHMDRTKFDISVTVLFGGGVNEQFLAKDIRFRAVFPRMIPANTKWMKLFTPAVLHKLCVRDKYDIEVSYLEGPSARVIAGCSNPDTKLVSWIHVEQRSIQKASRWFRSRSEAQKCYRRFDRTICVSQCVKEDFSSIFDVENPCMVLYNTIESEKILSLSREAAEQLNEDGMFRIAAVGSLKPSKGYDRLLRITKRLMEQNYPVHLYILGIGPLERELRKYTEENNLDGRVTFLGYQTNPYKFVAKCNLFVCASHAEGFSTAATEALIVGTPVCTVEVSGMKEMLGADNEYGIVTENNEDALYNGIKDLLDNPDKLHYYQAKALERGRAFSSNNTVTAVENMFLSL